MKITSSLNLKMELKWVLTNYCWQQVVLAESGVSTKDKKVFLPWETLKIYKDYKSILNCTSLRRSWLLDNNSSELKWLQHSEPLILRQRLQQWEDLSICTIKFLEKKLVRALLNLLKPSMLPIFRAMYRNWRTKMDPN